jgi:hypothetical protein
LFAHSNTGRVPFEIHGYKDRRVAEAYQKLLDKREKP